MLNFFNKGLVNAKLTHTFSSHGSFNKTLSHFGDIHFFSTKKKNTNKSINIIDELNYVEDNNDNFDLDFAGKFRKYSSKFNNKYISSLKYKYITNLKFSPYFCTYDLETFKDDNNNIATPYIFSIYIPEIGYKIFYGLSCIEDAIKFIINYNYSINQISFYAHYGGGFDAYLIMKEIIRIKGTDTIEQLVDPNNNIFYIKFEHNNKIFEFKDSYKLIPLSLDRILKGFKINVDDSLGKLPFDHTWVKEEYLNYNGEIPDWLKSHKDLLIKTGSLKDNKFNFKTYAIAYNKIDTVGLHKAIEKFFRILVDNFHIDFTHCLTLPQLVMELYRKRNLDDDNNKIRLLSQRMQNIISKAYYGAHTSVYIPYGEKLYYYDINSLYPYCMLKTMPIGTPKKYDVNKGLQNFFGFAFVKVIVPKDLKIPVLPVYVKIEGVEKLIFPTGTFKGYYFSEELKHAEKLGCTIQLVEAWEFQKSNDLFKEFVEPLYELKRVGNKDERDVFKLCLNTLYGKWGQHRQYLINIITGDLNLMENIEKNFSNIKQNTINENIASYQFERAPNPNLLKENPELFNKLSEIFDKSLESRVSNIAIAAAITSYARIEIDFYKRLPGYTVYYSDTDCVILDKPLPKEYLGDELGKMKNELSSKYNNYSIENDKDFYLEKGIFLRDKVYSVIPLNRDPIIKFSGLNKRFINKELHDSILSIYLNSGKNLKLPTFQTSKNINTYEIKQENTTKVFSFNYNKRILIRNEEGVWIDTKPIHISSERKQFYDFEPLIGRQNRLEKNNKKIGLAYKEININHYNVFNTDYKIFDGFFLNYNASILGKLPTSYRSADNLLIDYNDPFKNAKNILLTKLRIITEKAIEENILVEGSGFLITEEYKTPEGAIKMNSIDYLNTFNNLNELLNIYEQHLNGIVEGDYASGNMISFEEGNVNDINYNINSIYLRVLIPKDLIRNNKVPAKLLKISSGLSDPINIKDKNTGPSQENVYQKEYLYFKSIHPKGINIPERNVTIIYDYILVTKDQEGKIIKPTWLVNIDPSKYELYK